MDTKLLTILNQHLFMMRDPFIYLAIDENSESFDKDDIFAIKASKAKAQLFLMKPRTALKMIEPLLQEVERKKEPDIYLLLSLMQADCHLLMRNYSKLKSILKDTQAIAKKSENFYLCQSHKCLEYFLSRRAIEDLSPIIQQFATQLDADCHPFVHYSMLDCLGKMYMANNQFANAFNCFSSCYELANESQMKGAQLLMSMWILASCAETDKQELGEQFFEIGMKLAAELRIDVFISGLHYYYGRLKYLSADYPAAVMFFQKSIESFDNDETNVRSYHFNIYKGLADALNMMGEAKEALSYQLKAEELMQVEKLPVKEAELHESIAQSQIQLKNWDEAITRLSRAKELYKLSGQKENLIHTLRSIAEYYAIQGMYQKAYESMVELEEEGRAFVMQLQEAHSNLSEDSLRRIAEESKSVKRKYFELLNQISRRHYSRFTGESAASRKVLDAVALAAMHKNANILITGESGVGKNSVARIIHYNSENRAQDFVPVSCQSIGIDEFETEFFGAPNPHCLDEEKLKHGLLYDAGEGTLYLDEIAAIPLDFQKKLISVIDAKAFPDGPSNQSKPLLCRIIGSSRQDVLKMVKENRLSLDFLHRLNTLEIYVPSLRERKEDLRPLVESFARTFAMETGQKVPKIEDSFIERLQRYKFPGNVRELRNIIEQLFILHYRPVFHQDILDNIAALRDGKPMPDSLINHDIKDLDRDRIIEALIKCNGKQKDAAKLLNMSESTLCRRIKRYKLK